jgi:4'-phosphopantetheinyl transferase
MTDRAGWAVTMISPDTTEVGCDLELVEPRSDGFIGDWLTAAEQRRVATARDLEQRYLLANLVWSAKESALKVLRTGLRRSTHSVEVSLGEDLDPVGWAALTVTAAEGDRFPGWWCRHGTFVLTTCAQRELPAPVCLGDPSPLASAVPAHTWLDRPTR